MSSEKKSTETLNIFDKIEAMSMLTDCYPNRMDDLDRLTEALIVFGRHATAQQLMGWKKYMEQKIQSEFDENDLVAV